MEDRIAFVVCGAVLAVLVAIGILAGSGGEDSGEQRRVAEEAKPVAPVPVVAKRVEKLRGLRFEKVPKGTRVSASQARREALKDFDRSYPKRRRLADEELYKLLGILPARQGLRDVVGDLYREQVAGFYNPRTGRLAVVSGANNAGRATTEITLAHELNHALEDQRFKLPETTSDALDDKALAQLTLTEGTATALMLEYADRHLPIGETLGESLSQGLAGTGTGELPPFLQAQLLFPYTQGKTFAEDLYNRVGDWGLVDYAYRRRPPVSTEQVMDAAKYVADERPLSVALPAAPKGYREISSGTLGQLDTQELLRLFRASGPAAAAKGWGGGRYALYRRGPLPDPGCRAPCRGRDRLVMRWRWDTPKDAREFAAAIGPWTAREGAELQAAGTTVTVTLAPR